MPLTFASYTMTKHVHFAQTNILYSPIPATPSPSLSASPLPLSSSPELTTPSPELDYHPAPYPRSPYPSQAELFNDVAQKPMHIHYLLAFSPFSDPYTVYDVSSPPSALEELYPAAALSEPATSPPLQNLILTCPHFSQDWNITIKPSSTLPHSFVSVKDVFSAIYRGLRFAVHPLEYQKLPDVDASHVNVTYYSRCGRIPDPEARVYEQTKGVKRVDFLKGRNRFMGLSGTVLGPDIWELNVS